MLGSDRKEILSRLFPTGIPELWCPLLTHYTDSGEPDAARMAAHLSHLSSWVKGYLIPGSTGDGWQMTEEEVYALLEIAVAEVARVQGRMLIGILKTTAAEARASIEVAVKWLQTRVAEDKPSEIFVKSCVCGFTVCPPGGETLGEEQIERALETILETGFPTALYQLPQITKNEITPGGLSRLAARFPNFILFKDTSGKDCVALSNVPLPDVFMVRGAEGSYARWLKINRGPYDGFLLSSANCFARELHEMRRLLSEGRHGEAEELSSRIDAVVQEVFGLVAPLTPGNVFANANKAMDHFFAYGREAGKAASPRLHGGTRIPEAILRQTGDVLLRSGFFPVKGYLE